MRWVLIQHSWLECICGDGGDARPFPCPRRCRKQNPESPKRNHEAGTPVALMFRLSVGVDLEDRQMHASRVLLKVRGQSLIGATDTERLL